MIFKVKRDDYCYRENQCIWYSLISKIKIKNALRLTMGGRGRRRGGDDQVKQGGVVHSREMSCQRLKVTCPTLSIVWICSRLTNHNYKLKFLNKYIDIWAWNFFALKFFQISFNVKHWQKKTFPYICFVNGSSPRIRSPIVNF